MSNSSQTAASVRELKARLSHYLRLVKAGQTVEVTDRGRPVGRIVPTGTSIEAKLEAMAQLGFVARSQGTLEPRSPVARTQGAATVAELLVEERG